jgi:hypothetical protein
VAACRRAAACCRRRAQGAYNHTLQKFNCTFA